MNYYPRQGGPPQRPPTYGRQQNPQHFQQNFVPQPAQFFDQASAPSWRRPAAKTEQNQQNFLYPNAPLASVYDGSTYLDDGGTDYPDDGMPAYEENIYEQNIPDVDFRSNQHQGNRNSGGSATYSQTMAPAESSRSQDLNRLDNGGNIQNLITDESATNLAQLLEALTKYSSNYNSVVEQKIPLEEQRKPPSSSAYDPISMDLDDIDSPPSEREEFQPSPNTSFDKYEKEKEAKFLKLETKFKLHSNTVEQSRHRIELEKLGIQIYNTYDGSVDDRKGNVSTEIDKLDTNDERKLLEQRKMIRTQLPELESRTIELDRKFKVLDDELSHLKKQHGVMCRRVQRRNCIDNDDHNVLKENANLQCEVEKKLNTVVETKTNLETMITNLNKKSKQIDDLLKKLSEDKREMDKKSERKSNEKKFSSSPKKETRRPSPPPPRKEIKKESVVKKEKPVVYFDGGSHWCKKCNVVCASVYDFFEHLHSSKHKTSINIFDRPWMPEHLKNPSQPTEKTQSTQVLPMKGVEFLHGSSGFYCSLCREFAGDAVCAEDHLKSEKHNKTYATYVKDNPYHEQCYNLEKMASLVQRIEQNNEPQQAASVKVEPLKKLKETVFVPPMMSGCSTNLSGSQQTPHLPNLSGKVEPFRLKSKEEAQKETTSVSKKPEPIITAHPQKSGLANANALIVNDSSSNMNLLRFKIAAASMTKPAQTLTASVNKVLPRTYGPEPPKDLHTTRKDSRKKRSRSRSSSSSSSSYKKTRKRSRSGSPEKKRQGYHKTQQDKRYAPTRVGRGGFKSYRR